MNSADPFESKKQAQPHPADDVRARYPFPIVGIGASAGGLEAFKQLLSALPDQPRMAFVLVQHLDPSHESRLKEILSGVTRMTVEEVRDGMEVKPDHVYVIAPNTNVALGPGGLRVTARGGAGGVHFPIDYLFRSLAQVQGARSIGVILSGSGSDGALGLGEIKAAGGITFAQDERSAAHFSMPRHAIESGCVDFVLPLEEIARRLAEIGSHPYLAPEPAARPLEPEDHYKSILHRLHNATGVDFSLYRDTTIRRRIMRRMALHNDESLAEYARRLEGDGKEVEALYQDVLINVTSFFRDAEMFEALKASVFPEILKDKSLHTPIRIWVPGCSTGEEAYSLAMALLEFLDDKPLRPPVQIFATDLADQVTLEKARAGVYPESIEADVTPARLRRFFKKEDHVYRIDKYIRDLCVFARQNLAADPPFSHVDLISCRNVLIYMSPVLQKRILPIFHYALSTPGYMVLGSSETVGDFTDLFEPVDRAHKIYAKKPTASRPLHFPISEPQRGFAGVTARRPVAPGPTPADYQREAERILVGRYAPPGVLVNENFDIIQFRGRTSPYLEPPPGEPTTNVLKMAHEGLFLELRNALNEAKKTASPVRREGARVREDQAVQEVNIHVLPVRPAGAESGCFLVLFETVTPSPFKPSSPAPGAGDETARRQPAWLVRLRAWLRTPIEPSVLAGELAAAKAEIAQLTHELAATKEYLQSLLEQQDAANEELRSANEEILSSNEELQSTNEELQIAHEELQAANEELVTVNEQLRYRNAELNRISNDLSNLLASTGIAVLMLDRNLCIRRFTDTAKALLNLNAGDVWRAFDGLGPLEGATDFHDRLLEAIENAQTHERVVQDRAGRWYMLRIRPYRADHTIDGAVLVMIDISERKKLEEELETLIRDLSEADRHKNEFLATLAHELRNPLAPIRNAVGVLRSKHATQSDIEWCRDLIDRQVGQMARLMDDLFDVARIARDRLELRRERMVLADALEKALEISRPYLESQGHDLVRELAPEAIWIEADPARISQVFSNLLNNAAKYTPPGGKIIVSGERREREAVVSVKDTGIGIPEELLPRVFDMFKQGKLEPGRSPGGLGLGLTLAKKLVELHGGRIEARSEGPGRGSEFIVRLPVAEPADSVKAAESQEPAPVTSQTDMPKRVLVVDDSEVQTHSLRMFLELNGYEVRTARDAPSALDLMGRFVPDVAVVDIGLPGMSGYALAQRIRERPEWHQLVLIAQTGWGRDEDRRNALRAGFDHHLTKPFEPEAMLRLMAEALKRPADENRRAS